MNTSLRPEVESRAVDPRIVASREGAMVFDANLLEAPGWEWFDPDWWAAQDCLRTVSGGRGGVAFIDTPVGACVLRHYRRGGLIAPVLGDRYVWNGRPRTRGFAEFKLLAALHARGLPVPAPIAAGYARRGPYYTADLITRAIDDARTLTELIGEQRLNAPLAERVGALIGLFHREGVDHADLNAHNILLAHDALWLIDFDRGEIRVTGTAWKLANLARLKRSLLKVGACNQDEAALDRDIWAPLMRGYERTLGSGS